MAATNFNHKQKIELICYLLGAMASLSKRGHKVDVRNSLYRISNKLAPEAFQLGETETTIQSQHDLDSVIKSISSHL